MGYTAKLINSPETPISEPDYGEFEPNVHSEPDGEGFEPHVPANPETGRIHWHRGSAELHANRQNNFLEFYGRMGMRRLRRRFPIGGSNYMNDYILDIDL